MSSEQTCSRLDFAFARFLGGRSALSGAQREALEALAAHLSAQQASGHSCIRVDRGAKDLLRASGLLSDSATAPLVLERDRLYTQRYWHYEQQLATQIKRLCALHFEAGDSTALIDRYFPVSGDRPDWQKLAAEKALTQAFCIITGGPGTGKTTTVVKILGLLQALAERPLHIALAAPTGKAAMRLQESIGASKPGLPCAEQIKDHIPEKVTTIHHLLGAQPPSPYFRHDAASPLPFDLLVIDEASMIDLALMSKLLDALKPGARLILLGDKDQLASVESGAVLADLTASLPDHTVELRKSHRFQGEIKALAEAVNRQQGERAWELLRQESSSTALLAGDLVTFIAAQYRRYLQLIAEGADFKRVLAEFSRFQALCSNRNGPRSVSDINHRVEQRLAEQGDIQPHGRWYVGRPVMVSENNAAMQLYNGDIGLCLADAESGQLRVYFLRPDGGVKTVLPGRLPRCETVYAMTIHKSQGSEFDQVLLVLAEQLNPVLTKELLYTGITRARSLVRVMASKSVFIEAVEQKVMRDSGLTAKLMLADEPAC
ncbi:exodeoxyribonuclease V subunit alpha [Methylomarinum sp. Ch1-1]|uniref:RecBCD enzyme subunit RecD n=1 Tax=Methylomarinum roseum TaxID=3067653 RepID=A0AAU7NXC3_9GAMM|nr:exodeoxyribonuclease V subunit alpha [Methylomarinum sp. Ch1-1]MDP4522230.1 exodeoxyribonuclease V subunit alpha [Methylomarinum sp. Ch1-1]